MTPCHHNNDKRSMNFGIGPTSRCWMKWNLMLQEISFSMNSTSSWMVPIRTKNLCRQANISCMDLHLYDWLYCVSKYATNRNTWSKVALCAPHACIKSFTVSFGGTEAIFFFFYVFCAWQLIHRCDNHHSAAMLPWSMETKYHLKQLTFYRSFGGVLCHLSVNMKLKGIRLILVTHLSRMEEYKQER